MQYHITRQVLTSRITGRAYVPTRVRYLVEASEAWPSLGGGSSWGGKLIGSRRTRKEAWRLLRLASRGRVLPPHSQLWDEPEGSINYEWTAAGR